MHAIAVKFSQNRLCRQTENLTVSNLYRFNSFITIKKTVTGVEMGLRFFLFLSIFLSAHISFPYKSGAQLQGGHGGHDHPPASPCPPKQGPTTKQGPTVPTSKISKISFYVCSEIIRTRNFMVFTVQATIFGQCTAIFHFF